MAGLSISIDGLEEIKKSLDTKSLSKKITTAIGITTLQLHNGLRNAVATTYSLNKDLNTVLVGKSISQTKQSGNLIENGLEYSFKPVRLVEFPNLVSKITIPEIRFLARLPDGKIGLISKTTAEVTKVKVLRSKGYQTVVGKQGYGGWKATIKGKVQIEERLTEKTWLTPAITRAPYAPLYGPSLSQMAATMYEKDSKVQVIKNTFDETLARLLDI